MEVREGSLVAKVSLKDDVKGISLDLELRRDGRLGLKIHEKLSNIKEIFELLERPSWLGEESDSLVRRALLSLVDEKSGDTGE